METVLLGLIILSSLGLIVSVLLQEGSSGMSGSIAGGAESLFGKKKSKGMQGVLERMTVISAVIFFISVFVFGIII